MHDSTTKPARRQGAGSVSRDTIIDLPIGKVASNPDQPRQDSGDMEGMAATIKAHGLQQPITATDNGDGTYTLIAGERRLMAARLAKQKTIPGIVRRGGDRAILALIENIQRQDLKPLEEAEAFRKVLDAGETQKGLAKKLGVGRTYIAQKVRLLSLPPEARRLTGSDLNGISEAAARQILRLTIFDDIATESPSSMYRNSWADFYAKFVLWTPWFARSVADVRFAVDEFMSDLWECVDRYEPMDPSEAGRDAEAMWQNYVNRVKHYMKRVENHAKNGRGSVPQIVHTTAQKSMVAAHPEVFKYFQEQQYGKKEDRNRADGGVLAKTEIAHLHV